MHARAIALTVGLVLLASCLGVLAVRIVVLERSELELITEYRSIAQLSELAGATRVSARLAEVELRAGESTLLELCARNKLDDRFRDAFELVFWIPARQKLALKVPLDAAHLAVAKHSRDASCLTLGGGTVDQTGRYALDVVWGTRSLSPALQSVPLRARVLARTQLGWREGLFVFLAAFGAMIAVLAAFVKAKGQEPRDDEQNERAPRRAAWVAVSATLLAAGLTALALRIPIAGSIGGFSRGLVVAAIEIGIAVGAARQLYPSVRNGLSLHAPERREGAWLLIAIGCAALLNPMARWAVSAIPSTSEAPIEAFISWPSGALTFAALGMCVPLAEEVFFRGFVFGALRTRGPSLAWLGTIGLFAAAHAQQAWGNWGALLSVTVTGIVLTTLRALTGSTLVPAVAHLLYNLSLWQSSFSH
jgi:membrane protease YdiL (CAAX protease family)